MKNLLYGFNIDKLLICYEICNPNFFDELTTLAVSERFDLYDFYLLRIEGKHYEHAFQIRYDELGEDSLFGELRFGRSQNDSDINIHNSGERKAWISVDNRVLYSGEFYYLDFISLSLCLEYDSITSLALCLDMSMDISKYLKQLMMCNDLDVIINGRKLKDRVQLTQEISYTCPDNHNKNQDLTLNINNSRGCSLVAYDKKADIENNSSLKYITDLCDNPKRLFSLKVHLNRDVINDYHDAEFNLCSLYDKKLLLSLFFNTLEDMIRFERNGKRIEWWEILDREITPPASGKKD